MHIKPIVSFCLFLALSFSALAAESGEARAYLARDNYGAFLEPIDGVYTGAGQDPAGYEGYLRALGDGKAPVIYMFYTGLRWNVEADLARLAAEMAAAEARTGTYGIAQIGLSMTTDGTPSAHYEQDVAAGKYDAAIDALCRGIRDLGHPVILRIGYEFNGAAWNGYTSETYKAAFRRVTERIRANRLECATCWDASATAGTMGSAMDFYPGDEWVDWWGINLFLPSEFSDPAVERFMADARARGKPVLIGESTPRSVGTLKGAASWNAWFARYFAFIAGHPGVKAISYINWNFAKYPQWSDWGDARLDKNEVVAERFSAEIARPPFILGRGERELRRAFGETYDAASSVPPPPPRGLRAAVSPGGVALSWNGDPSVRRWVVLRDGAAVGSTGLASFLDRAVGAGESASYAVIAHGKSGADSPPCPAVAVTLPDAVEKAVNGGFDDSLAPWVLTLYSGGDATAELDSSGALGAGNSAKVTVRKGSTDWFVQLSQPVLTRAGRGYTLALTAKADRPCSVQAFIQQAHEPYASLASRRLSLTKEPQTFTIRVPAPATDDRMNLTVMLGGNAGRTVWIDSVSLVETR
jgi:hypothetical protein